jgi:hypothetical protein
MGCVQHVDVLGQQSMVTVGGCASFSRALRVSQILVLQHYTDGAGGAGAAAGGGTDVDSDGGGTDVDIDSTYHLTRSSDSEHSEGSVAALEAFVVSDDTMEACIVPDDTTSGDASGDTACATKHTRYMH